MNLQVEPDNLLEFLENTVKKYPDKPAFGTKNASGVYEWVTYGRFAERVDHVRGGLAKLGVGRDDAVGIIANNRLEWAIAAFASYGLCARFVPMYENELQKTWHYIVTDSTIKVLFVSKPEILEKVREFPALIPTLKKLVLIEGEGPDSMTGLETVGQANPVASRKPRGNDIAGLIYTSGTTGDPKGVLLSHHNFASNSIAGLKMYPEIKGPGDYSLSILPWAHSYGQTAELNAMIYKGGAIGFMENVTTIVNDMSLVRPTWLIAVPRVFNRIYDGLWKKMDEEGGIARKLFVMGVEAAKRKRELAAEGKTCLMTNLKFRLADKIVFQKIREKMGGRLKGAMTGSAAMNVEIANFFFDVGIPTYDCYGMTETSPAIAMNASYAYRLGSVGRAIENVRIEIDRSVVEETAKDGEIVVYGPNVMQGYHNKPEETRQVMTSDGGIRTGDRGRLDNDGYLFITGRIKEQFKLENGKFVFPAALEEDICLNPYVANAMIYGENRPYTVCLVVPDFFSLEQYAEKHKLPGDLKALVERKEIQDLIAQEISNMLKGKYGGYEIPKKFYLLAENFSLENGTLTQTMKVKRKVVLECYMDKIEALYR
ncbi:MAG TPA: long-chain fatty acid--CoA ligase [Syntrophus sp. (in: bacteria)]|nr:long-chain fatty acid--CoA ligase [Syntrophus sp. (in: bacteria)]